MTMVSPERLPAEPGPLDGPPVRARGTAARLAARWHYGLLALVVVVLDQLVKALVVSDLGAGATMTVVPGVLSLALVLNSGAVWGTLQGVGGVARILLFVLLPVVVTAVATWHAASIPRTHCVQLAALSLVVGGAVGNLIDRVRLGHVVDFVLVHLGSYTWPAFNVADAAICTGVVVLLLAGLRDDRPAGAAASE